MASCKRRSKEEIWASGMRQTSNFEMDIRRYVGITCFILSIAVAEIFRRYYPFQISYDPESFFPMYETAYKTFTLSSLSGAGIMLYAMGELSQ